MQREKEGGEGVKRQIRGQTKADRQKTESDTE